MKYEPGIWKRSYQDDGYLIVHDLIDPRLLAALCESLERITGDPDSLPSRLRREIFLERDHVKNNPQWYPDLTPEQCGNSIRQIGGLLLFDEVFAELICYTPLLDALETLFESSEFGFHLLVGRPKAARVGNGVRNGVFHRDTPDWDFTSTNAIIAILCLDEMTGRNGPTVFLRGSHKVSDEEARQPRWRSVAESSLNLADKIEVCCSAGSGIFFSPKIIHAAGHNRSDHPRGTLNAVWTGPDALPTTSARQPYEGLKPRSGSLIYGEQLRMTFPKLFTPRD
ncbi:MAG TPA: phytanoyl-CoA dioxygenase family protein [Blastocatellia bacterium]|nr:phytanoyl-CoA dioxygenase family protein [Blastocatellia bacterium]